MIVLKSTYNELRHAYGLLAARYSTLVDKYTSLASEWNDLVAKVNAAGGTKQLGKRQQFTPTEVKDLIRLCHPDKHNGSELSEAVTKKLLTLRDKP